MSFRCDDDGTIHAFPDRPIPQSILNDLWRRTAEPLILQALGFETLHASAILAPTGAVAFCGERQAGKSTLAYALSRRGYRQYSDDMLVLQIERRETRALDRPFGVRLRSEPAAFFGFSTDQRHFQDVVPIPANGGDASARPLAAVCVLRRVAASDPAIERLAAGAALQAVVQNAHCFNPDDEGRRRLLRNYLQMTATVPVYELRFSPGLERLDAVLACLETVVLQGQLEPA